MDAAGKKGSCLPDFASVKPDLLAQLADRWTYYPEVQGSIPEKGVVLGSG